MPAVRKCSFKKGATNNHQKTKADEAREAQLATCECCKRAAHAALHDNFARWSFIAEAGSVPPSPQGSSLSRRSAAYAAMARALTHT